MGGRLRAAQDPLRQEARRRVRLHQLVPVGLGRRVPESTGLLHSAVLDTAKAQMEPYEWAFWMEGKPADKDIKAPDGTLLEKAGTARDGGSFEARMGAVACWNAVMDENDYMVRKWNEFIAA